MTPSRVTVRRGDVVLLVGTPKGAFVLRAPGTGGAREVGGAGRDVTLLVGAESIRWREGLATAVPDGAEIPILPAVSGGARPRPPASTPIA